MTNLISIFNISGAFRNGPMANDAVPSILTASAAFFGTVFGILDFVLDPLPEIYPNIHACSLSRGYLRAAQRFALNLTFHLVTQSRITKDHCLSLGHSESDQIAH